jgi:hypothetical protein
MFVIADAQGQKNQPAEQRQNKQQRRRIGVRSRVIACASYLDLTPSIGFFAAVNVCCVEVFYKVAAGTRGADLFYIKNIGL